MWGGLGVGETYLASDGPEDGGRHGWAMEKVGDSEFKRNSGELIGRLHVIVHPITPV